MSHTSFAVNLQSIVCLNVKELLARSRHHIWSLSDSNGIRTHNHLVHKRTPNHLAKLAKWLSCAVSTYLYNAFVCMLLSCHIQVLEWIYTLLAVTWMHNWEELTAYQWFDNYIHFYGRNQETAWFQVPNVIFVKHIIQRIPLNHYMYFNLINLMF